MLRFRTVGLVCVALFASGLCVSAQTLRDASDPAEIPPSSFIGKQYVDSRGCVYIRAGFDGAVTWVPRVTRDRKLVCGFVPTVTAANTTHSTAPVATATPAVTPKPRPVVVAAAPVATPPKPRPTKVVASPAPARTVARPSVARIPRGFRKAWDDGRLNANRGPRTAAGNAQMAAVWTNTVPMQEIGRQTISTPRSSKPDRATAPSTGSVSVSSRATAPKAVSGRYVQVATFGQRANANTTIARLQQFGLPVSTSALKRAGKDLTIVMAGPFKSASDANSALGVARGAGFSDAFLRN